MDTLCKIHQRMNKNCVEISHFEMHQRGLKMQNVAFDLGHMLKYTRAVCMHQHKFIESSVSTVFLANTTQTEQNSID